MLQERSPNVAVSPCSNPDMDLESVMRAYRGLGYRKFEVFTGWAKSAVSIDENPVGYRSLADSVGMKLSSFHLPPVDGRNFDDSLQRAVRATRFAAELGVTHVIFKAVDRPTYIRAAGPFLDAVEGMGAVPVLQNHAGMAISSLADFQEVIEGIADSRMKTLLEVGHFHAVGVPWSDGYDLLGRSVALVHIKDMRGAQSVPFGQGEVDLPGLFKQLTADGYSGDYVVEMEVQDPENTMGYLAAAVEYLSDVEGVFI